jgi:prevent-host-death family protein
MTTDLHEARTHFSKLLERATRGEDVVISRAGTPVAVLVRIDRYNPKRELGFAAGAFTMSSLEEFNAPLDPETIALFHGVSEA